MKLLWRILPVCVIGVALWRVIPAVGDGVDALGGPKSITSLNAARIANSLQGELGAAFSTDSAPGYVGRRRLDGWDRPYQIRKTRQTIEVVSCGEDGRCGTNDDIIEVVRDDGSRERMDASFKQRPGAPEGKKKPKKTKKGKPGKKRSAGKKTSAPGP